LDVQYGVVLRFQILPFLISEECFRTEGMRGAVSNPGIRDW